MKNKKNIGKKIVLARREAGFSQEEFAKKMGKTRQTIYTWENELFTPSIKMLKKIAEVTGKTLDYFLQEDNSVNQQANGNSGNVISGNSFSNVGNVAASHGGDIEGIRQELRETRESLGDKIKVLEAKLDLILEKLRKGK